jgi:2,3-bisphosphoglycerate-independent phosphoglycerate mutase
MILDGFGVRDDAPDNAVTRAKMPFWRSLCARYPATTLDASESFVGLPEGQMGNSEVGHLNIGAGRVVWQDLTRIDGALAAAEKGEPNELTDSMAFQQTIAEAKRGHAVLHVLGLLSAGGVHSHEKHIFGLIRLAAAQGVARIRVHAFLDGRDTPPRSASSSLMALQRVCDALPAGQVRIASICGRYYAMDRDRRWDRTERAYRLLTEGDSEFRFDDAQTALQAAYARGENDEFVQPTALNAPAGDTSHGIDDGDTVMFMNFRADRARQLVHALTDIEFNGFVRRRFPELTAFATLTFYGDALASLPVMFASQSIENGLGEYLSKRRLKQLRIAETEKYAHVTYFFSGGVEAVLPGEERILVPSPKVATYDLQPAMSAPEVTDKLIDAIESGRFDFIVVNYANGDMVGHSGKLEAAVAALETVDQCLRRVVTALRKEGGEALITADHGNAEMMFDPETQQPHTAHTLNPVPLVYVGRAATLASGGALRDLAPSALTLMGLPKPPEMDGRSLITLTEKAS